MGSRAISVNGNLYILGGCTEPYTSVYDTLKYDTKKGAWIGTNHQLPEMRTKFHIKHLGGNKVIIHGGTDVRLDPCDSYRIVTLRP